ncbi:ARM repeat-containing protein [Gigaspora margarita]|uniref:ARM repeat-containing protein n=1 Tax=Gigaspora margarita TaxID=4874 RepID=A0A8H3XDP9_GIGMA|nr:ARM repeat-containing protein [Gigaspora margarita]
MNRTSSTTNTQKINYAQAAAQPKSKQVSQQHQNSHQSQQQQQQQQPQIQQTAATTPSNNSTSVNGKSTSQPKPQPQHNSVIGNGNANTNVGRSTSTIKATQQKNPVQLPTKGQPRENNAITIQFGSLNQPSAPSLSTSPVNNSIAVSSGGALPTIVPKINTVFGSVTVRGASEELAQPTPTPPAVVPSGPGAFTTTTNTTPRPVAARINEIPRTQSAPPQLNLQDSNNVKNVGQPSGHQSSNITSRTQPVQAAQQLPTATPHQQPTSTSNTPHNRKDSVSSTVSSNDGQQNQHFHPHQPQSHHTNHNHTNQHAHSSYHPHGPRSHPHHKPGGMPGSGQGVPGQYRPRDNKTGLTGPVQPSPTINPAQPTVPPQGTIPLNGPQPPMPMNVQWAPYRSLPQPSPAAFYPAYGYIPTMPQPPYVHAQVQRPPMPQHHIPQQTPVSQFATPSGGVKSRAIPIINPADKSTVVVQPQPSVTAPSVKKEETPTATANDGKKLDDVDKEKEKQLSDDKKDSKAIKIVNPVEKDKIEREKKEKEEREQREREEKERIEREEKERKVKEEIEQREREEREREEERIRKEQEEKERQEREEKERREREEKEREEKERKEREEKERKEREEKERKEREEKERKEREERERKEREERERKEREERERKEREEKERKEQEERERKERDEKERREQEEIEKKKKEEKEREEKEREEKEREEKERKEKEREEKEREEREREEKEREEKEREEKEREDQERIKREKEEREKREREEQERIEKEHKEQEKVEKKKEEAKAKTESEEAESKKEAELVDKKDPKKDEKKISKSRPGPLDLSRTTSAPAGPLSSARLIDDLNSVQYPPHIKSPNPSIPGKYKYDRSFLMQFMNVCKEKPENLPTLDAIGMDEPKDDKKNARNPPRLGPRSSSQHSKSSTSQASQFQQPMGDFKSLPKSTNEDRFMMQTTTISRTSSGSSSFGRSTLGPRTGSGSTLLPPQIGGPSPPSPGRAGRRDMSKRTSRGGHQMPQVGQDQVTPLELSENRWVPGMINPIPRGSDELLQMDIVQRKVKALLNKLTLEKFDSISDQIIEYANKSKFERDGRMLKEVIRLTFEKSCDEPNFSQMYAQLCRKMMERVDPEIVDENVTNAEGKFVQGGTLFRKYLLNRCQEDFEKGWKVNVPVPSNEKGEPDLMSDEYYTAARAKRHGLGLIRFIGELFKLNMLTERIMHECVKKLLTVQNAIPEEEEMESLCKLMTTVGQQLDHAKAKSHMDAYFHRMEDISKNSKLSSRIKFMLMDVIDLRNNSWVPRRDNNAPKTIAEIHEDAAKQKEEAEILRRAASSGMPKMADQISRGGSGRRDKSMSSHGSSGQSVSSDGWNTVGGTSSASRQAGDLSKFGSVSRSKVTSTQFSLAPGGATFASLAGGSKGWKTTESKDRKDKTESMSRTNSTSNTYGILAHSESTETRKIDSSSVAESTKSFPASSERKKIILAPRSTPLAENPPAPKSIMTKSSANSITPISKEVADRKIISTVEEYLNIVDMNEVILCINELPKEYHSKTIETFSNKVLEKKQDDVDKVIKLFDKFIIDNIVDKSVFIGGFTATVEFLIDIGADAPKSYTFTGQLFRAARLDSKDVADLLKPLSEIDDKGLEKVMAGYNNSS